MAATTHYAIRGGAQGRERLRILARTMHASTTALFERLGVGEGLACLDVGCGGGDVAFELARRVGAQGRVVGVDLDQAKLALASQEAEAHGLGNVEFRTLDIRNPAAGASFDMVYARFLLSHLEEPRRAVEAFYSFVRPGGLVIVEDIDASGCFTWPESDAFRRYWGLYCAVVQRRGGDPNIGPRLPLLLADGGFERVEMNLTQPIGTHGEVKLINPITMENIADAVLADGLASQEEIDYLIEALHEFAANPRTVAGLARVIQAWGRRPPVFSAFVPPFH
jgi:SAM-dependent methyltransferase